MFEPPVRACPLCGSRNVVISEPNPDQAAAGVTCVLICECGAVVTLSEVQPKKHDGRADNSNTRRATESVST
jgi:hypothetical protein